MLTYVARRLLIAIPVLFGVMLISFIFLQMLPGDPVRAMTSPERLVVAGPEYVEQRRAELGLDDPVAVQFVAWMREVFQGNFGYSFHERAPVTEMISARLGPTLLLTSTGIAIALLIGVPIGVFAALKQNSWVDYMSAVGSMIAISIPNFFLALAAIYVFAVQLDLFPTGGMQTVAAGRASLGDSLQHLVLPAGILAANLVGPYVRFTRQGMLDVLHQDHITTARAKGVPRRGVIIWHALRNALIPLTTMLALQLPMLFGGVLIIEEIFGWPGIGRMAFSAITSKDYPVILAVVLISALLVMLFNLLADLLAAVLDPRIRL